MLLRAWLLATVVLGGTLAGGSGGCSFYCFHLPLSKFENVNVEFVKNMSCTHFVYGFAEFGSMYDILPVTSNDIEYGRRGNYDTLAELKTYIPISLLLGIRSWRNHGIINSAYRREMYIKTLFSFARYRRFDGFVFEFSPDMYRSRDFLAFLKALDERNKNEMKPIQIVLAVGARYLSGLEAHWMKIAPYVNAVYMISDDIPSKEVPRIALHQHPLKANEAMNISLEDTIQYNADKLVNYGVPPNKIVIGLSAWSRSYKLKDATTGHRAPALRYGNGGHFTNRTDGYLAYHEVCKLESGEFMNDKITATSSFLGSDNTWYTITRPGEILQQQLDYIKQRMFNGVGLSSILGDDKDNVCGEGSMPIHNFVRDHSQCSTDHQTRTASTPCTRMCTVRPMQSRSLFEFNELQSDWCSHIIVSTADLLHAGFIEINSRVQQVLQKYHEWNVLDKPPVLLSIGEDDSPELWRILIATEPQRALLIQRMGKELKMRRIDGVDISWTQKPLEAADVSMFNSFVEELREAHPDIIIVVTLTFPSAYANRYDMNTLSKSVNYVILQGHRFHDHASLKTGHNSPMFISAALSTSVNTSMYTMETFAADVVSHGMPSAKIVIGMSAEGIVLNSAGFDKNDDAAYNHALGGVNATSFSKAEMMSQGEICETMKRKDAQFTFHEEIGVPTVKLGARHIAFENSRSVRIKTTWSSMNNYGGVALYALEKEITSGECDRNSEFSLVKSIASAQVCEICQNSESTDSPVSVSTKTQCSTDGHFRVVCIYRLANRQETDPLLSKFIPFHRCQDIVVEGIELNPTGSLSFGNSGELQSFWNYTEARKNEEKNQKGKLKVNTMATIHCNMNKVEFTALMKKNRLVSEIGQFVSFHGFSGVQFKCNHVLTPATKQPFADLLQQVQNHFKNVAKADDCPKVVGLRIPVSQLDIENLYDVSRLNRLDSVMMETIPQNSKTADLFSPIFSAEGNENDNAFAIEKTVEKWAKSGIDRKRIIMHIPTYGVSQHLMNNNQTNPGASTIATSVTQILNRKKICEMTKYLGSKQHFLYDRIATYLTTLEGQWTTYDTAESVTYKVRYAQREKFGGIGIISLNDDDFSDYCKRGHHILLNTAVHAACRV